MFHRLKRRVHKGSFKNHCTLSKCTQDKKIKKTASWRWIRNVEQLQNVVQRNLKPVFVLKCFIPAGYLRGYSRTWIQRAAVIYNQRLIWGHSPPLFSALLDLHVWQSGRARFILSARDRPLGLTVHQRVIDKVIVCVSRVSLELFIAPYSESDPRRPAFGCCTLLA